MKALIDIKHPAQLNLFRCLAGQLKQEGWDVTICYLERGKLPDIIRREYKGFDLVPVGESHGTRLSIIWNGNVTRAATFYQMIKQNDYDICIAASSIPLALAGKMAGVPVIQFYDDPERRTVNAVNAALSSQLFFPPIVDGSKQVSTFNCLKEWSYLCPARFNPDASVPEQYGLKPNDYVFVREVSNKSFNYYGQASGIVCNLSYQLPENMHVVLSLEDKSLATKFPSHWIILKEPVADIHSLIYHSKLVISSGDSMAREGAMLGVPSIYCGTRNMRANEMLMERHLLEHHADAAMVQPAAAVMAKPFDAARQITVRKQLENDWDDMLDFMMRQVSDYKKTKTIIA